MASHYCYYSVLCIFLLFGLGSALCPSSCTCPNTTTNQVSCADADLQNVPQNIPQSVTTLDLSGNRIHTLHSDSLQSLRNVVNLKLKLNQLRSIEAGCFAPLESLQTLDASDNALHNLDEHTFTGGGAAKNLLHLDLSNNQLEHVEGAFAGMISLSRLDLRNNKLSHITQFTFRDLTDLRYLLLTDNLISHIDKRAFRNLSKLMYLVLKGNPIHRVPKFEFNSYFLSYVDLSECGLKKVPRGLPNSIRYLQLRRNNMTTVTRHSFQDCPYVSILVLDENGIEGIHERTFEHMTYLQQLWLNGNKLSSIPQPLPQGLQRLLMDQNQVKEIQDVFPDGSKLHTLSFMGNNITKVEHDALLKLTDLKSVDLSNNKIEHIYGNTYSNASKLKTLQLSKNPLKYFHSHAFHGLTTLKTLSLAYVQSPAVSIYPDIFSDLKRLKKLDLDSSPGIVRSVFSSDALLADLSSIEDLSMQSCELATLRGDFPGLFPQLGVLHISSSRWHCDTRMLWFRNWLLSTSVHIEAKHGIVCVSPDTVRGKELTSLEDIEFAPVTTPLYTTTTTTAPLTIFPSTTVTLSPPERITSTTATSTTTTISALQTTTSLSVDSASSKEGFSEDVGDVDLDELLRDFENSQDFDPFNKGESTKVLTWEEYLSRTLAPARGSLTQDSSTHMWYSGDKHDPDVDMHLLGHSTDSPDSDNDSATLSKTTIIIVATTLATVVIAVTLITVIVYLLRKQKTRTTKKESYQNGIKYKHRNDVLYFMPANGDGGGSDKNDKGDGSTTDSLQTTTSKEGMTLIPGRDINHEGPLRVYKWEEF